MRKSVIALTATPFLVFALSSCSSTTTTTTPTPASSPAAESPAAGGSDAQSKVTAYCEKVKDLSQRAKDLQANPEQKQHLLGLTSVPDMLAYEFNTLGHEVLMLRYMAETQGEVQHMNLGMTGSIFPN